jgi:hypothetical protein
VQHDQRQLIETVGRVMARMRPHTIQAVTAAGVEGNVCRFGLADRLNGL